MTVENIFIRTYNKIVAIFKEYCLNCSLAGVGYIANSKYHVSERIFWLICVAISSVGSYHLIEDYIEDFERQAVSLVIEDLRPQERSKFPTIGICEEFDMLVNAEAASKIFSSIAETTNMDSLESQEVESIEDFLMTIAFPANLNKGTIYSKCYGPDKIPYCPKDNFTYLMREIPANCPELFETCKWNGKEFNCCEYFYRIRTTMGICYLMNSIQTKVNGHKNKLNLEVGLDLDDALLELKLKRSSYAYLLNEEDVPESALSFLKFPIHSPTVLKLSIANIINDEGVRNVHPDFRKCRFPDENLPDAIYKYYSFTACVSNCFKRAQLLLCKCAAYQYIAEDDTTTPSCDLNGLNCLDENDLLFPTPKRLQPWNEKPVNCTCLPSCTENEILMIENSQLSEYPKIYNLNISLINLPYERYRRQAVRGKLDIVVSIGGILGLFMGASILSGIELIYYLITGFYYHFFKNDFQRNKI